MLSRLPQQARPGVRPGRAGGVQSRRQRVVATSADSAAIPSPSDNGAGGEPSTSDPADSASAKEKRRVLSHRLNESFATDELLEEITDHKSFAAKGGLILILQLLFCGLVAVPPLRLAGILYLAGVLSLLMGAIAALYSVISLGRSFSPLVAPRKNNELVRTGMYQYMRHPLYAGLILLSFGLAAVTYSETRLVLALLLQMILTYKARKEEEGMLEAHGAAYEEYMREVDRFFPTL